MFILMPVIFVLGILAIALEDKIKINKAAIALFMAISLWMILMFDAYDIFVERSSPLFQEFLTQNPEMANAPLKDQFITFITNRSIVYHLGNVSETLFFVMCSMLIVDIVDKHGGFRAVTGYIRTANKRKLLWYISFAAFFFSALLDNLAACYRDYGRVTETGSGPDRSFEICLYGDYCCECRWFMVSDW